MSRTKAFAGALLLAALVGVLGVASPASAESQDANCQATYPPFRPVFTFKFTGTAYYSTSGGTETIDNLGFLIHGAHTGGESDVGFGIYENGRQLASGHTPDTLQHDQFYSQSVSATVASASVAQVRYRAAFDIAGPDPHCSAVATW